ncbi:hypothetical protein KW791_00420 [Candidatus Parcubacteria bacterium]|nr:hypothetical protein [Candidatus Parcubacteria bacterium]
MKTKARHKQRPWNYELEIDSSFWIMDGEKIIAKVMKRPDARASAHVIAAAPELLEALKELFYTVSPDGKPVEQVFDNALAKAAKVIDKAEGR